MSTNQILSSSWLLIWHAQFSVTNCWSVYQYVQSFFQAFNKFPKNNKTIKKIVNCMIFTPVFTKFNFCYNLIVLIHTIYNLSRKLITKFILYHSMFKTKLIIVLYKYLIYNHFNFKLPKNYPFLRFGLNFTILKRWNCFIFRLFMDKVLKYSKYYNYVNKC